MRVLKAASWAQELIYTISAVIKAVMCLLRLGLRLINTPDHFSVQQGNKMTVGDEAQRGRNAESLMEGGIFLFLWLIDMTAVVCEVH